MAKVVDKTITCPHKDRPYKAKGMCQSCYSYWMHCNNKQMATCHPDRPHYAKSFCSSCYCKWRRSQHPIKGNCTAEEIKLTAAEYDRVYKEQNGLCAICKQPPALGRSLVIDHDHAVKKFRGLLCQPCNMGLGGFKDSLDSLAAAQIYLAKAVLQTKKGQLMSYTSQSFKGDN